MTKTAIAIRHVHFEDLGAFGPLRHLFAAEELLGLRLLSLHNVRYLIRLAGDMRCAIAAGDFAAWADAWRHRYLQPEPA